MRTFLHEAKKSPLAFEQFVVAILDDAAVVKRFYKKKNGIELISENPDYKPIVIDKKYPSFKIVGIVVGVYRSMEKAV